MAIIGARHVGGRRPDACAFPSALRRRALASPVEPRPPGESREIRSLTPCRARKPLVVLSAMAPACSAVDHRLRSDSQDRSARHGQGARGRTRSRWTPSVIGEITLTECREKQRCCRPVRVGVRRLERGAERPHRQCASSRYCGLPATWESQDSSKLTGTQLARGVGRRQQHPAAACQGQSGRRPRRDERA